MNGIAMSDEQHASYEAGQDMPEADDGYVTEC